ncbi:MAG: SHOCT domain-containing protein [Nitrospirales bacterium]
MSANMMERMTDCGWMPMMGFGMLFMALFWVALIVGVVLVVKRLMGQGGASREDSALDILKKRYARGEINKQEFEERKRDLLA